MYTVSKYFSAYPESTSLGSQMYITSNAMKWPGGKASFSFCTRRTSNGNHWLTLLKCTPLLVHCEFSVKHNKSCQFLTMLTLLRYALNFLAKIYDLVDVKLR